MGSYGVLSLLHVLFFSFIGFNGIALSQTPAVASPAFSQTGSGERKSIVEFPYALPVSVHHVDPGLDNATESHDASQRHLELLREKLADKWFAALIETDPGSKDRIATRLPSWRSLVEFIEQREALVDVWAFPEGITTPPRRIPARELGKLEKAESQQPTFITLTWRDQDTGDVRTNRVEFGFNAADRALAAHQSYRRHRELQLAVRDVLSARGARGRFDGVAQWKASKAAEERGLWDAEALSDTAPDAADAFVAAEYAVDDFGNFSRVVRFFRQSEVRQRIVHERAGLAVQVVELKNRNTKESREARGFRVRGVSNELEPAPNPVPGRDIVELRIANPTEPDARKWNVLEFGEPELARQSGLATFSLINAHLDRRRKQMGVKKANLDLIAEPILLGLNVGGGLAGLGLPAGDIGRLFYNLITPRFISSVPTVKQLRELLLVLAAREMHPDLKIKPAQFLDPVDVRELETIARKLTPEQVRDYLDRISEEDLEAMVFIARVRKIDAQITNFLNILTSAGRVSGVTDRPGILRDIFNNTYFSLNGDLNIKTILSVALGHRETTPLSGVSLESLSQGRGPASAWLQFFDVSIDIRALINTLGRLSRKSFADKELHKPLPYALKASDLAAYEVRIFGFPLFFFYKRGLIKDDLNAFEEDYAYGIDGPRIVEHFRTKEAMDEEIRAGRMWPLGYVQVPAGRSGWKDSNLAVFAHKLPEGPRKGRTVLILYGLKAYSESSEFVGREVARFRQFEKALVEGAVIEKVDEIDTHGTLLPSAAFEPEIHVGGDAVDTIYASLLGDLLESRRASKRKTWGLPLTPAEEREHAATTARLQARGIPADERECLLEVDPVYSSFRFEKPLGDRRRVVKLTYIPSIEDILRALRKAEDGRQIERERKAGISLGARGVVLLNRSRAVDGRNEVGPAATSPDAASARPATKLFHGGSVPQAPTTPDTRRSSSASTPVEPSSGSIPRLSISVERLLDQLDRMPVTDRARLAFNRFASTLLDLDLIGDGTRRRVFVTVEFPIDTVIVREHTNAITGERERLRFKNGEWLGVETPRRILEIEYDPLGVEIASRLWHNAGAFDRPIKGALIEQTRTLETWRRDLNRSDIDPYQPVIVKLCANHVTGLTTRETFGLFPSPVVVADEHLITETRFSPFGLLTSANIFENGVTDADFQRAPLDKLLKPSRGRPRYEIKSTLPTNELAVAWSLASSGFKNVVERRDLMKDTVKTLVYDAAYFGRVSREEYVDTFDGTRSFRVTTTHDFREDFFYGLIPTGSRVASSLGGTLLSSSTTLNYDLGTRQLTADETDNTGRRTRKIWDSRWASPVAIDSAVRQTTNQFNRDETSVTGITVGKSSGEEIARFTGRYDRAARTLEMVATTWFRPGITHREEISTFSAFGKPISVRVGSILETRFDYDADGRGVGARVLLRNPANDRFDRILRIEDDYRTREGQRDARVQTFVNGQPYDVFRTASDSEGRVITNQMKSLGGLTLSTSIAYDGDSERVLRSETLQNNVRRALRVTEPEVRQADGAVWIPVRSTVSWGGGSLQSYRIGDILARPVATVLENGDSLLVTEWFDGTAVPKVTERRARSGLLRQRFLSELNAGIDSGIPYDLVNSFALNPWGGNAASEVKAFARGTDIALFSVSAGEKTYFDLTRTFDLPEYRLDPNQERGLPISWPGRRLEHVVEVFSGELQQPGSPGAEPTFKLAAIDLRGLFFHKVSIKTLDRFGNVLEERIGRVPNLGEKGYSEETLRAAIMEARPTKKFRYRYQRGWLVDVPDSRIDGGAFGRSLVFTNALPSKTERSIRVNEIGRDFVTQIDGIKTSAEELDAPNVNHLFFRSSHSPRICELNPYMPQRADVWTRWTSTEFKPDGAKAFDSELYYDAQGRLAVSRAVKTTSSGEAGSKIVYRLHEPAPEALQTHPIRQGIEVLSLDVGAKPDLPGSDFVYLYLYSTSQASIRLVFKDHSARPVTASAAPPDFARGRVEFWPLQNSGARWLPDSARPSQAAAVTVAGALAGNGRWVLVSAHDLSRAGLDLSRLSSVALSVSNATESAWRISPLWHLKRGGPFVEDRDPRVYAHDSQTYANKVSLFGQAPLGRGDRESLGGVDDSFVLKFNGLPAAFGRTPKIGHAIPQLVLWDSSDEDSPVPLYAVSRHEGHFLEHYKMPTWGDAQVYSVVNGFEIPKYEVFSSKVLNDETGPGFVAYGYDYSVRFALARGEGFLPRALATLQNRIAANTYRLGGEYCLRELGMKEESERGQSFTYSSLHRAGTQAENVANLPILSQALLSSRALPWTNNVSDSELPVTIDRRRLALRLLTLHVTQFPISPEPGTGLIPTSFDPATSRYVDTVKEARLIQLALHLNELSVAHELLDFYWNKSRGGLQPLHAAYDGSNGAARAADPLLERAPYSRQTAGAQIAVAEAAFDVSFKTGDTNALLLGRNLVSLLLSEFRPAHGDPRAITEHRSMARRSVGGFALWPEAGRYPVAENARAYLLFRRLDSPDARSAMDRVVRDPAWSLRVAEALREEETWLRKLVLPHVERTGVVPTGLFELQDVHDDTMALAAERWSSTGPWLDFLEAADAMNLPKPSTRHWLENLARAHGTVVNGVWGLDSCPPLGREDVLSPELTARFLRVSELLGHTEGSAFARRSLNAVRQQDGWPVVTTASPPLRPLRTGDGSWWFPDAPRKLWPASFGVQMELAPSFDAAAVRRSARPSFAPPEPPKRTDLAVFASLTGLFYLSILGSALFWWRFRAMRRKEGEGGEPLIGPTVPDAVMQRAEERWAKRVLGVQTPDGAENTRFSNGAVEQNFLMQLRAIYKLVAEWRRQENGWSEDDASIADGESDDWLNGMDEVACMTGIYMRWVIKAGAKDGFDRQDILKENEDSNHIWSRLVMYFSEYYWGLLALVDQYQSLVARADKENLYGQISKLLTALGVRQRPKGFDARTLLNFPANPAAMDLLSIQKPGMTLEKLLLEVSLKLRIPYSHLAGFVERYKTFKRRERPDPIHPYVIELAKVLPHFLLMGLGALVWYNQSMGESPIVPYLWSVLADFIISPRWQGWTLLWGVPLLGGFVCAALSHFARIYRFDAPMLPRSKPEFVLDATVTSLFAKRHDVMPGLRPGWKWNPAVYDRIGWGLRAFGFTVLGLVLLRLPTPSFATFLVIKGLLAMTAFAEVAAILLPLLASVFSKWLQDRVTFNPRTGSPMRFIHGLNITATRPASPLWLSFRYHTQPSVPHGSLAIMLQTTLSFFALAALFAVVGAYLCQEMFPLWFTDKYLTGADWKLFFGGLFFWNTMYLLRYGLFLGITGVASFFATFPIKAAVGALAVIQSALGLLQDATGLDFQAPPAIAYPVAAAGIVAMLFEKHILDWLRRRWASVPNSKESERVLAEKLACVKAGGTATLGVVYMSGDDLSHLKLTPALLRSRWTILRDKLDSNGVRMLFEFAGQPDDDTLERWFQELYDAEKNSKTTLWHPIQVCVAPETPRLRSDTGLNIVVGTAESRDRILTAWHVRRWLVTMMSTAGHAQDTAVTLVDIAVRLHREGLGGQAVFYLIQNKYDNNDNNRPVQTPYDHGELAHRNKLTRLLKELAPGCRAFSLQNWTPFGFKAGGLTGMDLVHEEAMKLTTMLVLDRNANVHDMDALMHDLSVALTDPDVVIVIPGRGTTNTLTSLGQGSQMVEEGHRSFLKGLMSVLGGKGSEMVGTGWGNLLVCHYGRVQHAMLDPRTPKLPLTSRMRRGSSFAVQIEGLIGFTPHAVGISEDTWAVSQAAHNTMALGRPAKFLLSRALWHKIRETWSQAEWLASFPRWSGGFLQMMHDPIMQRINDLGPASVFAKEVRANSGRNFLTAPFALLNILLMPLAIMLDVTPFVEILVLLWNFGFIMNQILTVHGLNAYLESSGFSPMAAMVGSLAALGACAFQPSLESFAPAVLVAGFLAGGFIVGLGRWLYTRVRDVLLFGPQLVLHTLGQVFRQTLEFSVSGASPEDAKGVNMAYRTSEGPREDRPLDTFSGFVNLRTIVWWVGLPSILLNLFALSNLDMLNVLLLLPSLLFSVSLFVGPFLMTPKPGVRIGMRIAAAKLLGWTSTFALLSAASLLIGRGQRLAWVGALLLLSSLAVLAWRALRFAGFRRRVAAAKRRLVDSFVASGQDAVAAAGTASHLLGLAAGSPAKLINALDKTTVPEAARSRIIQSVETGIVPLLRGPGLELSTSRFAQSRFLSAFGRSFVLSMFVLIWFFIVPVPGLFVFTARSYKISVPFASILGTVALLFASAQIAFWLSRALEWIDRAGRQPGSLDTLAGRIYGSFRAALSDRSSEPALVSGAAALLTDAATYVDQRSNAYARNSLTLAGRTLQTDAASDQRPGFDANIRPAL